jgi:excisionase family DNA binding protein
VAEGLTLLTVAEVAASLRVSTMTVYRLIQRDELGALRIGRSYRIAPETLAAYLQHSVSPSTGTEGLS